MAKKDFPLRRSVLGALALAMLGGPAAASGCSAGFAPISQIDGLRILAVAADEPYANPGDTVNFTMTYADSREGAPTPQIVWLGGCFDPPGDAYYACYEQLAGLFQGIDDPEKLLTSGLVAFGPTFSLKLPEDLITRRPQPQAGAPWYGVAYVFFVACAGELRIVPPEGTGVAGSFPIGCFSKQTGARLGADNFVPGFTQIYAFADGRPNTNPTIDGMTVNGEPITGGPDTAPEVEACPVAEDARLGPPGCGKADPFAECPVYDIAIQVPSDIALVADEDPTGSLPDGTPLRETVWVDYFSDRGNFRGDATLVSDSVEGLRPDLAVTWIAPPDPGPVRIWAVIHDNRGGQAVVERYLRVK